MVKELHKRYKTIADNYLGLLGRVTIYQGLIDSPDTNFPKELLSRLEKSIEEVESFIMAVEQATADSRTGIEEVLNEIEAIVVERIREKKSLLDRETR